MTATARTRVRVDEWGISHIAAADQAGAFEAQGYVHAADRIWQMEWDRRRALGRWSEVVGWAGAREDAFFLRLGLAEVARSDFATLKPETQHMAEAYARGVNRWLDEHLDELPAEFDHHPDPPERWEPWHCVAVYKVRHIFMGTLARKLWRGYVLREAGPELTAAMTGDPMTASAMVDGAGKPLDLVSDAIDLLAANRDALDVLVEADGGSNSWAVHGTRTASGSPLLAGDPHRGIEFPNVYHQSHISCPDFDAIGLGFPGVPGFAHFGHNADVAWCITHGMADDTDVFIERFGPGEAPAHWAPRSLKVRGEDEPIDVWCGNTDRGPIVLGDPGDGAALSMQWTGISAPDTTLDALLPMLTASSCDELEDAVRPWVIPVNNLLSADRAGDISFHIRGRVVERSRDARWTVVAGDADHDWNRLEPVPFDDLPASRNPDRGFLVTANNRISDRGPYVSLDFAGPARHDRIVQLLEPLDAATIADMTMIHTDVRSLVAPAVVEVILGAATACTHERTPEILSLLAQWDCELASDSVAATVYGVLRRRWAESVGERLGVVVPELGAPGWPTAIDSSRMLFGAATQLLTSGGWRLVPGLQDEAALSAALSSAVDEAAEELTQRLGDDVSTWTWGRVHRMASPHPLASALPAARHLHPPVDGCPGDSDTVRCGSVLPETGERAAAGSVARYVFDLADWDNSGWVVTHGVSGVRESGHDLDQRQAWLDGSLVPMSYSERAIAQVTVREYVL